MAEPHTPTTLLDWLDDLTVRFLLNLPSSELSSVPRLCFQVEEAQWFYEDFVRPAVAALGAPPLPSLPLRQFCLLLFQHCPLLSGFTGDQHLAAYEEFLAYKVRVPVRGAILLDDKMEKVVLVRGYKKGASWSFPRGKINKDEKDLDCAVREVYEETGYDAREAGLLPKNENDAKYIDITMREQHMRLFVFRGVPEETYFEPKTRKEISKIQWYAIRDLPGFKKQKSGGDAISANKFYMVAPFLGPLKKWISLQKKKDQSRHSMRVESNGYGAQTTTEDEGDIEDDETPERDLAVVDGRADELKRMLSMGGSASPADVSGPEHTRPDTRSGNLLAMLQGSSKPTNGYQQPHTPFEQISTFAQEPPTPQPDHLRQPSLNQQQHQAPPQFPFSPARFQQEQQRNYSLPTPNVFGPGQSGFPPNQPPTHHGIPGMAPPPMQHQYQAPNQQRQSIPGVPPGMPFNQHNGLDRPFNSMPNLGMPPHVQPPHMQNHQPQQPPQPNAFMAQGPQGAIGSGPAVPKASQLPPPRLNAHSMNLLNAFKNDHRGSQPAAARTRAGHTQRPASTHQAALLDLFRKPSTPQSPAVQTTAADAKPEVSEPTSPTLTDVTVKPSKPIERRPTLNEITRTLPTRIKSRSPVSDQPPIQVPVEQPPPSQLVEERPKERQLFDPDTMKFIPASKDSPRQKKSEMQQRSPNVLQPPQNKQASRSPKIKHATPAGLHSKRDSFKGDQNGAHPAPHFTILPRPGLSTGSKSPAPPRSPEKIETEKPTFQPQVLKRPKASDVVPETEAREQVDKRDQLLALFGKTSGSTNTPPPTTQPTAQNVGVERRQSQQPEEPNKNTLLNLFSTDSYQQHTPAPRAPPPAPKIEPEHRPTSKQTTPASGRQRPEQQNLLLDLFNSKKLSGTPTTSPGTPISPFTLGTPAVSDREAQAQGHAAQGHVRTGSRLGSMTSVGSGGGEQRTPTEAKAKEFLMGYLNGVVRSEGYRSAGSGSGGRRGT